MISERVLRTRTDVGHPRDGISFADTALQSSRAQNQGKLGVSQCLLDDINPLVGWWCAGALSRVVRHVCGLLVLRVDDS